MFEDDPPGVVFAIEPFLRILETAFCVLVRVQASGKSEYIQKLAGIGRLCPVVAGGPARSLLVQLCLPGRSIGIRANDLDQGLVARNVHNRRTASPDDPVHTFPVHEYVPIVPAWQVLKFLDGWLRVCMVEFTHFVPSGKKYAKPDSKNGCPSGVKPCERNRYVAESASDDCAWARGMSIPSHPMSVSSRKPSARILTAVVMVAAANGAVLDQVKDLDFICSSSVVASPRGDSPVGRLPRRAG